MPILSIEHPAIYDYVPSRNMGSDRSEIIQNHDSVNWLRRSLLSSSRWKLYAMSLYFKPSPAWLTSAYEHCWRLRYSECKIWRLYISRFMFFLSFSPFCKQRFPAPHRRLNRPLVRHIPSIAQMVSKHFDCLGVFVYYNSVKARSL